MREAMPIIAALLAAGAPGGIAFLIVELFR